MEIRHRHVYEIVWQKWQRVTGSSSDGIPLEFRKNYFSCTLTVYGLLVLFSTIVKRPGLSFYRIITLRVVMIIKLIFSFINILHIIYT